MNDRELLELAAKALSYDSATGELRWHRKHGATSEERRWNARYADQLAGTKDDRGYIRVMFKSGGRPLRVRVHQLAWLIVYGQPAAGEVDHINGDKADNRIANLRDVPKSLNQRNRALASSNTSGHPGVTWHKQRQKWCAQTSIDGNHHHLGLFARVEDAAQAARAFRLANGFTDRSAA